MLNPNYIIGLVDGEGSFTVYVRNPDINKNVKRRVRVEPRFYLKLIEKDKSLLYKLKKFFKCGNVYFQIDTRPNHQNCYRYEVSNRSDLKSKIIPFFKKNRLKLPSKRKDFELFCRLMTMIDKKLHSSKDGLREIYQVKQQMH
ncbi:MAG: LAGLIDADG family homing endonuclease [Parcubacteria group bacterium]